MTTFLYKGYSVDVRVSRHADASGYGVEMRYSAPIADSPSARTLWVDRTFETETAAHDYGAYAGRTAVDRLVAQS